jgi:hypothetical protein
MPGEHTIDERRSFPRLRHAEAVQFQFKNPRYFGGCLSCDLSEGGARLRLNDFIPLNTQLILQIRLAAERVVDCVGRVVWVQKERYGDSYQVGLEFSDAPSGYLQSVFAQTTSF